MEHTASASTGPANHASAENTLSHRFGCGTGGHAARDDDHARGPRTEATNARGEQARAAALRAQLDELNAELAKVNTEAERALTRERMRADRLGDRIAALQRDLDAARVDVLVAQRRADTAETDRRAALTRLEQAEVARDRAEQGKDGERVRANALRDRIEAVEAQDDRRLKLGRWARLRTAWRGE